MVFCVAALPVLLALSLFSVKYRGLARQALACVLRRATLRPCQPGAEHRLKKEVFGALARRHRGAAFFFLRHFEAVSWALVAFFAASALAVGVGAYNLALYGNCNGPQTDAFCPFNPGTYPDPLHALFPPTPSQVQPFFDVSGPWLGPEDAPVRVVEVGCYSCPYTRAAEPYIQALRKRYGERVRFAFHVLPLPSHPASALLAQASFCALDQNRYWALRPALFSLSAACTEGASQATVRALLYQEARAAGLDANAFSACLEKGRHAAAVEASAKRARQAGVYATPTYFVNDTVLVSPASFEELARAVEDALQKTG